MISKLKKRIKELEKELNELYWKLEILKAKKERKLNGELMIIDRIKDKDKVYDKEIYNLRKSGKTFAYISNLFNISNKNVRRAFQREKYKINKEL